MYSRIHSRDRLKEQMPGPGSPPTTHSTPRIHTGRTAFSKCQGPGQHSLPPGALRHIPDAELQTLSVGPPENILNWNDDCMQCICQVLRLCCSIPNREPITRLRHWGPVHKVRVDLLAFH
ncbi:hypothetical protein Q8A73_008385 [Channa argus]|nr:hypothetical protein Q8A73_008385 [Channa argus]